MVRFKETRTKVELPFFPGLFGTWDWAIFIFSGGQVDNIFPFRMSECCI